MSVQPPRTTPQSFAVEQLYVEGICAGSEGVEVRDVPAIEGFVVRISQG